MYLSFKRIRRWWQISFCLLFCLTLFFAWRRGGPDQEVSSRLTPSGQPFFQYIAGSQEGPRLTAAAALLLDQRTGTILYAKNEHERRAMASLTKIMTAIVVLERARLTERVTVSRRAARVGGSSVYLQPGERFTVEELLKGAMLESGNDACVALAEHVGGSVESFVELMNQRAAGLGAGNTHFVNPHGLTAPNHYASAFDLALLANYARRIPRFAEIVRTREDEIGQEAQWVRKLKNTNKLLWSFAGADGIKTGTTNRAGKCLVASATRDGRTLLCVLLRSYNRWGEAATLLEYGFSQFKLVRLAPAGKVLGEVTLTGGAAGKVAVMSAAPLELVVRTREVESLEEKIIPQPRLAAPVKKGQPVAWLQVKAAGEEVRSFPLLAAETVPCPNWLERLKKFF